MDYEQKCKEYLERAKEQLNGAKVFDYDNEQIAHDIRTTVYSIFPELKESEDERIRKELITHCRNTRCVTEEGAESIAKWIAWIEKQGQVKNSAISQSENKTCKENGNSLTSEDDNIKFKQGEWIVWQDKCYKVNYNGCGYELVDQNGLSTSLEYGTVDENAHLWDITKDAQDGDVLLFEGYYNSIVLFQGIGINGKGRINYHCKCDLGNYSFGVQGDVACLGTIEKDAEHYHPATKEQREQLEKAMADAGYTFDFDKKELKKIEQNPVWSEEDNSNLGKAIWYVENPAPMVVKDSMLVEWLKSIKERVGCEVNCTTTKAWSEEDERNLQGIIDEIEANKHSAPDYDITTYDRFLSWLKSLKARYTWKPSDEQMHAFEQVYDWYNNNFAASETLTSLYKDLKKLKE